MRWKAYLRYASMISACSARVRCQRPTIERHHLRPVHQRASRIEAVQIAEQEPHGVAHAAIGIRHALQDLVRHAHLVGVVGRGNPQPQHIGPQAVSTTFCGSDDVAERLRLLRPFSSTVKPWVSTPAVGRALVQRLGHQQRAVEPAAMLIRAFQVQVHRRVNSGRVAADALERHARVGPDVHHVRELRRSRPPRRPAAPPDRSENQASMPPLRHARGHGLDQLLRARMQLARAPCARTAPSGTPQVRWREMHQSGRFSIMPVMRCSPHAGVHCTPS